METENKTKENCGCEDGNCCTPPKKNNLWTKIIFSIVIVAALAIIIMKLTCGNCKTESCSTVAKTEKAGVKDSTAKPCCSDPNSSCCDKSKK
ncbi:MAG: hypothetical protein WCH34_13735 [Bacteroidota bacterium]